MVQFIGQTAHVNGNFFEMEDLVNYSYIKFVNYLENRNIDFNDDDLKTLMEEVFYKIKEKLDNPQLIGIKIKE